MSKNKYLAIQKAVAHRAVKAALSEAELDAFAKKEQAKDEAKLKAMEAKRMPLTEKEEQVLATLSGKDKKLYVADLKWKYQGGE
jgi:hypothetical protein